MLWRGDQCRQQKSIAGSEGPELLFEKKYDEVLTNEEMDGIADLAVEMIMWHKKLTGTTNYEKAEDQNE